MNLRLFVVLCGTDHCIGASHDLYSTVFSFQIDPALTQIQGH